MGNSRGGRGGVRVYMYTLVVFKHESWKARSQFILKTDITEIVLCWNFRDGGSLRQVDYFILSGSKHQNKKEVRDELRNYFNTDLSDSKPITFHEVTGEGRWIEISQAPRARMVTRCRWSVSQKSVSNLWIMTNCSFWESLHEKAGLRALKNI